MRRCGATRFAAVATAAIVAFAATGLVSADGARPAPRPGIFLVRGDFLLQAEKDVESPRASWPLPVVRDEQVPLTYEVRTDPDGSLASVALREDGPGNVVLDAVFHRLKPGAPVRVTWTSNVLCGDRSFADVPAVARVPAKWPAEAEPWLRTTRSVQCDDARFRDLAKELRKDTDDVREIVRRVLRRAGESGDESPWGTTELTAIDALDRRSPGAADANFVAAALRACGVPARLVAGYPTWSGPVQTHFVVEAYVPGFGWYPVESTMLQEPARPFWHVAVSIVRPEQEDASAPRHCVTGGVPRLSLTEVLDDFVSLVGSLPGRAPCDHVATLRRELPTEGASESWKTAMERGRALWRRWIAEPGGLDARGRIATPSRGDAVHAATARELAEALGR